jgi:hypothetical protein
MEERWKCDGSAMEVRGSVVEMHPDVMQSEGTRCGRVVEEPRGEGCSRCSEDLHDPEVVDDRDVRDRRAPTTGGRDHSRLARAPIDFGDALRLARGRGGSQLKPSWPLSTAPRLPRVPNRSTSSRE